MNINKIVLNGRIGKVEKLKSVGESAKTLTMSLAENRKKKGEDGKMENVASWHSLQLWGDLAIAANEHLGKGDMLRVYGSLEYNEWEKDGIKRKDSFIKVSGLDLMSKKGENIKTVTDSGQQ